MTKKKNPMSRRKGVVVPITDANSLEHFWNAYKKVFLGAVPEKNHEPFKIAFMFGCSGTLEIAQNLNKETDPKEAERIGQAVMDECSDYINYILNKFQTVQPDKEKDNDDG